MTNYLDILKANNQEHLLKYIEMANEKQKEELIKEIEKINFDELKELYKISKRDNEKAIESKFIEHVKFVDKYKMSEEDFNKYKKVGENIIKNGEKYGVTLNWYIMTSTENDAKTEEFFKEHNYFDYPKDKIKFFKQGNLPLVSEEGKLLVDENFHIKYAADGNGCIYKSMRLDGILDDMKEKGIKWIFIGAVDNALLNMVDPILLGLTVCDGNQIGSKSVVKRSPEEPVGVFCKKDGKPGVIEYTELPTEMAHEVDEEGELLFGESHIMCNLYSIDALDKISKEKLPYHSAHKKAPYMNEKGELIKVTKPNAFKYEAFIFDGFSFFDNISILRGRRNEDFAPVKNAEGEDSPKTAIELYNNYWKNK